MYKMRAVRSNIPHASQYETKLKRLWFLKFGANSLPLPKHHVVDSVPKGEFV